MDYLLVSLQILYTQLPPPLAAPSPSQSGNYLSRYKLINRESVESDDEEEEEDEHRESSPSHSNKYSWAGSIVPSMGQVILEKGSPSVRLNDGNGVRISTLWVDTGKSVLARVDFGAVNGDKGLYIDQLVISNDSYLEFDLSKTGSPVTCYVFTQFDYSSIIHRIGFYAEGYYGERFQARSVYWGDGLYCISMDEYTKWQPPMVPEPTTYGAGLMGMGLAVVGYRSYLRRRQTAHTTRST